jgi:hypothetical protein
MYISAERAAILVITTIDETAAYIYPLEKFVLISQILPNVARKKSQ